jgi:hypothetical protein
MIYRRYPLIHRKTSYPGPRYAAKPPGHGLSKGKPKYDKTPEKIPLPNEPEKAGKPDVSHTPGKSVIHGKSDIPRKPGYTLSPGYAFQTEAGGTDKRKLNRPFSFLNILHKKIQLEEIIILGLIFLLLNEEIRDDILLVVLIYILLT